ncbi:MAG: hypothetical protein AABZ60_05335 [Planctomycetota bacterium]
MSYGELLFGNIAIQFRYATQKKIEEALEKQQNKYPDLPLGEILIRLDYLTNEQRDEIVRVQFESKVRPSNLKFGKLLILNGFISQKKLLEVIEKQKIYLKKTGKIPPLGKLLISENLITPQQKNAIISIQHRLNKNTQPSGSSSANDLLEIMEGDLEKDQAQLITTADFKLNSDERSCPACESIIMKDLTFCPQCKTYFCSYCTGELDAEKRFCQACGKFVEGQAPKLYKRTQKHSSLATSITYIFFAVALIGAIFLIKIVFTKEKPREVVTIKKEGDLDTLYYDTLDFISKKKFDVAGNNIAKFRNALNEKSLDSASHAVYLDQMESLSVALSEAQQKLIKDAETAIQETKKEENQNSRPLSFPELMRKAKNLMDIKDYPKATATLEELNARPERTWQSLYMAGEVALKQEKIEVAIKFFEQSRELGGSDFAEKDLTALYNKLLPLYSPLRDAERIILLLEPLPNRSFEYDKLLLYSYWHIGKREQCWEILFKNQSAPDLKCQVLLAEYALIKKKPEMILVIMQTVTQELKTSFVDFSLWKKWHELATSKDQFLRISLKSGKEIQGKLIEETPGVFKIETPDKKMTPVSKSQIAKQETIPNPDLVLLERFIEERAAVPFNDIPRFMELAKKYLENPVLKPFCIAILIRFEDEVPDAFELIRENGFQGAPEAFLHHSLVDMSRALDFSTSKLGENSLKPIQEMLVLSPDNPYLLYFLAAVSGEMRKTKEALEALDKIPPQTKIPRLQELRKQMNYQIRAYCPLCHGAKGEGCNACGQRGKTLYECPVCKGSMRNPDPKKKSEPCPKCSGQGKLSEICSNCKGAKFVRCSYCGTGPGEPFPEYEVKRLNWFMDEELARFMQNDTIKLEFIFPKTKFKY